MLTRNFYHSLLAAFTKKTITNGFTDYTGAVKNASYSSSWMNMIALSGIYNLLTGGMSATWGVRIGSGSTPATLDDFALESVITTGYSVVNQSSSSIITESDNGAVYSTYAVTNTSTTPLKISEIGLFGTLFYEGTSKVFGLLDRTVLDEPIVINPGETKSLTYTIRMNYPTA